MRRLIVIVLLFSLLPAQALASTTFFSPPLASCGASVFGGPQDRPTLDRASTTVSGESGFAALILTHAEISDGAMAITMPGLESSRHEGITDVEAPVFLPKLFYPFYRPPRA